MNVLDAYKMQKGYEKVDPNAPMFAVGDKYDPYVWKYKCERCPNTGYLFGKLAYELKDERPLSPYRGQNCKSCKNNRVELYYKLPARQAIHMNNIRRRGTDIKVSKNNLRSE